MNRKKIIYLAVTNDLVTDNRVHKIASTLLKSGAKVTVIGRIKNDLTPLSERLYKTIRFNMIFKRGFLFYKFFNIRLFVFLLFHRFNIVVANDLDTLPGCFLAAILKRKKLVYDSHEYFTEVPELVNRKFPKKVWQLIEKMILPRIKYSYTVSESIAETYNIKYGISMQVVRNVPYCIENLITDGVKEGNQRVILYQGSVNIGRGLEHMIDAMEYIENTILRIIGDGDIKENLKKRVVQRGLENKIKFISRLPFENLFEETCKADLGIALEENIGLNYYYALPNKLFDYIQARIPVLVSPFPEMQKIVRKYDIGTVYNHQDPQSLAKKIIEIFELKNRYQKWKENTDKAALDLCWEKEEQVLKAIYTQAGLNFNN
ncbi:MAG: glycosyltransferase [Bacteroidales bacterium]|jgi:glycosyltransferase involved in cell wall biosynthesis|nr:glycosyltransferase [Bacteroidales bacterium]